MPEILKVFGSPGCGKTTRLLSIMDDEFQRGLEPERLALLTFTVAARLEARTRAMAKFGYPASRLKWVRTLHSTAYELLGVNQGTLVTAEDGLGDFASAFGYTFTNGGRFSDEGIPTFGFTKDDKLLAFDHFRRHRMRSPEEAFKHWVEDGVTLREVIRFTDAYVKWKTEEGRVDFTDLLERGGAALPCDAVIVDEAQDLSPLQWKAFWQFAGGAPRVYIAGDDDQAIYEWAGADPATFLAQPGLVEVLPQSFRCPQKVSDLAHGIIQKVHVRQPKAWSPRAGATGVVAWAADVDQLRVPEHGSVLFLYRNHKYADAVVTFLRSEGLTFTHQGRSSVTPAAAQAIVAWERLRKLTRAIPLDDLEAIFAHSSVSHVTVAMRKLARALTTDAVSGQQLIDAGWDPAFFTAAWFRVLDRLAADEFYLRKVIQKGGAAGLLATPRVQLSTIHGAKGGEADHVVLITEMSRLVRKGLDRDPDAERRVWYVGVTRAKETLTLVGFGNPLF